MESGFSFSEQELIEYKNLFDNKDIHTLCFKIFQKIRESEKLEFVTDEMYYSIFANNLAEAIYETKDTLIDEPIEEIVSTICLAVRRINEEIMKNIDNLIEARIKKI